MKYREDLPDPTKLRDALWPEISGLSDSEVMTYDPEFDKQFGATKLDHLYDEHNNQRHKDYIKKVTQIIRRLQKFALDSLIDPDDLTLDKSKPLDSEFIGSSCRVYEGEFQGKPVAIKLLVPLDNIIQLQYLLTECSSLKVAKDRADVGPGFYGLIKIGNKFGVVMDKLDGQFLTKRMYSRVNGKSVQSFQESIQRLTAAGFTFIGDSGQLLIKEDGEIQFCDIQITPLNPHGELTYDNKQYPAQNSPWYIRHLQHLKLLASANQP